MKVYELAKDLNLRSVELVDQLRKQWGMPVRNHMQNLSDQDVDKVKKFFKKKIGPEIKKKPTVVRRRTTVSNPQLQTAVKQNSLVSRSPLSLPAKAGIIRRRVAVTPSSIPSDVPKKTKDSEVQKDIPQKDTKISVASSQPQTGRHIRPGLVTGENTDFLKKLHEPVDTMEVDKRKIKKNTLENQVKEFRATDFRKREIIFQPKKKRLSTGISSKKNQITKPKSHKRVIKMYSVISLQNLAHQLGVKQKDLVKKIKKESLSELEDQEFVDHESAALIASFFDFEVKNLEKTKTEVMNSLVFGDLSVSKKTAKPPVVTVMGHVNHGKTSLLDYIRKSRVVEKEAGGITQHIGAYSVPVGNSFVTFIDTPGHAAFAKMRARGAQVTDIVVIVVSADDGVQPQTIEAINHARNAKAPVIVAVNKMDLPNAQPDQVKKQMMEHKLVSEEWGGDTIFCPISALKGDGVKELLEHIHLLAEVHELKANPERSAVGVVIESRMEKGRGGVMTLLVQDGTLQAGQVLVAGPLIGRARQMTDDRRKSISSVGPGRAVEISGFSETVPVGEVFYAVKNEKEARKWISQQATKNEGDLKKTELSVEDLLLKTHLNQTRQLNIILKTDVVGSLEAIKYSIQELNTEEVEAKIIHSGLGPANESDVLLADAGKAMLLCFNVNPDAKIQRMVSEKSLTVKSYKVIYDLLKDVEKAMAGLLDPEIEELPGGKAEVKQVFQISDTGTIAGCQVQSGKIANAHFARLIREDKILYEGKISSLKRFKQSAKEVSEGQECGIGLGQHKDLQPGDIVESFVRKEIIRDKL